MTQLQCTVRATATEKANSNVPKGYGEPGPEGGRPKEKASVYGTNDDPMGGRDPLGIDGMHGGFPSDNENVIENLTTQAVYHKNKESLKHIVFNTQEKDTTELLNEDNIKDLGN